MYSGKCICPGLYHSVFRVVPYERRAFFFGGGDAAEDDEEEVSLLLELVVELESLSLASLSLELEVPEEEVELESSESLSESLSLLLLLPEELDDDEDEDESEGLNEGGERKSMYVSGRHAQGELQLQIEYLRRYFFRKRRFSSFATCLRIRSSSLIIEHQHRVTKRRFKKKGIHVEVDVHASVVQIVCILGCSLLVVVCM